MTTQLEEIFINDSQLFRVAVYDVDGVTPVTPLSCTCSVWNLATGANVINNQAGTVGAGFAQYNWVGSATPGSFEAVLTVTISGSVIKSENFLVTVLAKPISTPHILTPAEAANFLRTDEEDLTMLMLLSSVDQYIKSATGRDWALDATIHPVARAAAGMLLVQWHENPSQSGSQITESPLAFGLTATLAQLEVEALKYRKYQFYGLTGVGGISIPGALVGDDVISLVGVYGASGNQSSNFESEISVDGQLRQTSASDLSDNLYVVILKSPKDDVTA